MDPGPMSAGKPDAEGTPAREYSDAYMQTLEPKLSSPTLSGSLPLYDDPTSVVPAGRV